MATKKSIMDAINAKVGDRFDLWRIGLTHDLSERKKHWGETENQSTTYWSDWEADSLSDAQEIEKHFINKGMKGGWGGDLSPNKPTYVYMF